MNKSKAKWENVYDKYNLESAFRDSINVCKNERQVSKALAHHDWVIEELQKTLADGSYKLTPLHSFKVYEPKERDIHAPNLYPDKIIDHAVLNVVKWDLLERIPWCSYGSLKYRGLHRLAKKIDATVRTHPKWYYLKTDFRHFYESVSHEKLKEVVQGTFKDARIIDYFNRVIDRNENGLAIGVGSSQYLANLFASKCDHRFKEQFKVKYYFRYMDDILMIVPTKEDAFKYLAELQKFADEYSLTIKNNVRIASVEGGVRMVGCYFSPTKFRLQKHLYKKIKRKALVLNKKKVSDQVFKQQMASYMGWLQLTKSLGLWKSILQGRNIKLFKKMKYPTLRERRGYDNWLGVPDENRISIESVIGRDIGIKEAKLIEIKGEEKVVARFAFLEGDSESEDKVFIYNSKVLKDRLIRDADFMPFATKIEKTKNYYSYK